MERLKQKSGDLPEMYIVVAMTEDRVIGSANRIPWHIPEELRTFKRITSGGVVIMGRNTFESIGQPLPDRYNLILSKSLDSVEGAEVFSGFEAAVQRAIRYNRKIFFIGGREVYRRALDIAKYMYISWIPNDVEGDVKFPAFDIRQWEPIKEKSFEKFHLTLYQRKKKEGSR